LLDAVWAGPETLIVVSTDLSHYLDYRSCQATDRHTAAAVNFPSIKEPRRPRDALAQLKTSSSRPLNEQWPADEFTAPCIPDSRKTHFRDWFARDSQKFESTSLQRRVGRTSDHG
jgi:hypothetical protein